MGHPGNRTGYDLAMAIKTWVSTINANWNTPQAWSPVGVPTASDDCVFNSAVATTATITVSTSIRSLNCTGFTGTITGAPNITLGIGGDMTLSAGMTFIVLNTPTIVMNPAGFGTATITSFGQTIAGFQVNTFGTVTLADDLFVTSFTHVTGTFNSNGKTVNATSYGTSGTNSKSLVMGSSVFNISGAGTIWTVSAGSNLSLSPDTSDIRLTVTTGSTRSFVGGGLSYNKLTIAGGGGVNSDTIIVGNNTFAEIAFSRPTGSYISFAAGSITNVTSWTVSGTATIRPIIRSAGAVGTQFTLRKPTPWYIGTNSTTSNSSGLILSAGGGVDWLSFTDTIAEVSGNASAGFFNFF